MNLDSYKSILLERDGKILNATLNRPETLNAINKDLDAEIARFFYEVAADRETNVVVLTGAGRAFSSGGDLELLEEMADHPERFSDNLLNMKRIIYGMIDNPKPVIAKVNGAATGLGATIALFSDVIFAAEHAKIGDPHVKVGFAAGDGGAIIWPHLVGYARAKEYLLSGELLTAKEAERIGLINHAVPAQELDERVRNYALKLANGATKSIQWTKACVNIGLRQAASAMMDASAAYENLSNYTLDHVAAVKAMRAKAPPTFTGE